MNRTALIHWFKFALLVCWEFVWHYAKKGLSLIGGLLSIFSESRFAPTFWKCVGWLFVALLFWTLLIAPIVDLVSEVSKIKECRAKHQVECRLETVAVPITE